MDLLIERAKSGEREAMEALLTQLSPAIHRFSMTLCRNPGEAEDVEQDTLLSVASHLTNFEGRSSLTSWVFALARSACNRRRRGKKNQPTLGEEALSTLQDEGPSPEQATEQEQMTRALSAALSVLPEDYRDAIHLRDIEGLSAQEAAEALGISVDALKSRLHRARSALREQIRPLLEPPPPVPSAACPEVAELWSRKREGDLSSVDCAAIEKHVEGCAACASICDNLRAALVLCQRHKEAPVPPAVRARVRAAVEAWLAGRCG